MSDFWVPRCCRQATRLFGRAIRVAERLCDGSRGLQPTVWPITPPRRGARLDGPSHRISLSIVAPRRDLLAAPIRGLKTTATFFASLREAKRLLHAVRRNSGEPTCGFLAVRCGRTVCLSAPSGSRSDCVTVAVGFSPRSGPSRHRVAERRLTAHPIGFPSQSSLRDEIFLPLRSVD
jgi:hypothetical protein